MNRLVESVQNVRWGRLALRWGAPCAARVHLECARYWIMQAYDGSPRALRVLNLVNMLALDLIFTEVAMAPPGETDV